MGQALLGLGKGGADVADWDGNELHIPPYGFDGGDEGGVLGGLVVKLGVATEFSAEADLDEDEVALLALDGGWVRIRGVKYPPWRR